MELMEDINEFELRNIMKTSVSKDELRRNYKRLVLILHPDKELEPQQKIKKT